MPRSNKDVDDDGRGPSDPVASYFSPQPTSQMGDRASSLPSIRGTSPGATPPDHLFSTPPTIRTGPAHTGSPSTPATARVSPVPPSNRQPAVPIRPPAFRPVPIQAPGSTGPPSRAQVVRAATAAMRQAAPGQRATVSQSLRPAASIVQDSNMQARPVVSPGGKTQTLATPNVRSAAPNASTRDSYARVTTVYASTTSSAPTKSAPNIPKNDSSPSIAAIHAAAKKVNSRQKSAEIRHAVSTAPLSQHRRHLDSTHIAAHGTTSAAEKHGSVSMKLFTSPPPRGSAQDSPAMMSACSSRQGSDMSASSGGSSDDRHDMSFDKSARVATQGANNTTTKTGALGSDYEFTLDVAARPQRRPRSPDEEEEEEAKRCCISPPLPQRIPRGEGGSNPPTHYATVGRRNSEPTPNSEKNATDPVSASPPTVVNKRSDSNATQLASAATHTQKIKSPRYPPLIVEKLPNWAAHFRAVREKLGHPPNARPYQNGIRFLPESAEEYRVVQRYLTDLERESGLSWFAYSLPAERSVKLAIRGLPADTEVEEIEEELRLHGYEPEYVRHIKARGERPGCIFHAVIKRTPDFRRIYDTTTFLYMRGVKIEAWRGKQGPAQCHRCQKFRHSSHLCHRPLACVRCGENHVAKDCPRPKTEPATCANCAGAHPASNPRCPVYLREAKNRRAGTVAISRQQRQQPNATDRPANAEDKEAPSESLMAAANGPTNRQEAPSGRRRKNKRGGKKGKETLPPATAETNKTEATYTAIQKAQASTQNAPVAADSKPKEQRSQRKARQQVRANTAQTAETAAPTASFDATKPAAPNQQRQRQTYNKEAPHTYAYTKPRQEFTACAIKLLMDLIKAIRQGQDVELVILDGLAELLSMYHG